MKMPQSVLVPLINPNEPEAMLASLPIQENQHVEAGQTLATFETTKAAADLLAETSGYIAGLRWQEGDSIKAGEILCYLSEDPDWEPDFNPPSTSGASDETPLGLRITQPALELVKRRGLPLGQLPVGLLITEAVVDEI